MRELEQARTESQHAKRQLLATVSALALTGFVGSAMASDDARADHPAVWIELGGQFDGESNPAETWIPPNRPLPLVQPPFEPFGWMPSIGYEWDGKISIQPNESNWTFSAGLQFGKAKRGPKSSHDQANPSGYNLFGLPAPPTYAFTDSHTVSDATHFILDFQAGRDLGLGLFGGHARSTINFGVRMAQFRESADGTMTAQVSAPNKYNAGVDRYAEMHATRSFTGIGPSIGWNASFPISDSLTDGLSIDWGASAAVLFGRQKARVSLKTQEIHYTTGFAGTAPPNVYLLTHTTAVSARNRVVVVPNIGGFAGLSYNMGGRGKIALGYRADFFFGAIDGGIETRKSENVGFYGPFASIGIGIGG